MSFLVEVSDLTKRYRDGTTALGGVTFTVNDGTIFGFLGPNGAGKTTTIRILVTLLSPTSGRATVGGYDVMRQADEVRRLIGYAGQFIAVDKDMTARENVILSARLQGMPTQEARRRTDCLLEEFSLGDQANRRAATLSGGTRRRLELAQALVHKPTLLFLDEPTTGLDPHSRSRLWHHLEQIRSAGRTIFLTTQYLEEADRLCDDLAVVDHGRIVVSGSPTALKDAFGHDIVTVGVDEAAPEHVHLASRALAALPDAETPTTSQRSVSVVLSQAADRLPEIVMRLDGAGVRVRSLTVSRPTLDDVFMAHTGGRFRSGPATTMEAVSDAAAKQ